MMVSADTQRYAGFQALDEAYAQRVRERADAYAFCALCVSVLVLAAGYFALFDALWNQNSFSAKATLCCASAGAPILLLLATVAVPSWVVNVAMHNFERTRDIALD